MNDTDPTRKDELTGKVKEFARETAEEADPEHVGGAALAASPALIYAALAVKYSTVAALTGGAGLLVAGAAVVSAHSDVNPAALAKRVVKGASTGVNPQTRVGLAALHGLDELHRQGQLPTEIDEWTEALDTETIEKGMKKAPEAAPDDVDLTRDQLSTIGALVASMASLSGLREDEEVEELLEETSYDEDDFAGAVPAV